MEAQSFAGNPLSRGLRRGATLETALRSADARFLTVAERKVGRLDPNGGLAWLTAEGLAALGLRLDPAAGTLGATGAGSVPLYSLGQQGEAWHFAVDVSSLNGAPGLPRLSDLRGLIPHLAPAELAVAGQAVALAQWHAAHGFCPRCGGGTEPAEGGGRRQCLADPGHRLYPRTDPVVIMLVESADGGSALLGRPLNYPGAMLTCLSGFVDQGESIEEAVAREVAEEAGLEVARVKILSSQPWPIGKCHVPAERRAGSCELMIGCVAQAKPGELNVDETEMAVVQWMSRAEVRRALLDITGTETQQRAGGDRAAAFTLPPPFAIAHHLLKVWANRDESWFVDGQPPALAKI